jgi:acyl carrier protein
MSDIAERLSLFIIDSLLLGKNVDVRRTPSFLEAGIIDSTGVLELVQFIEEQWGIEVKDEEMVPDNLDSIDNLVRFILKKTTTSSVTATQQQAPAAA